jgi:hypothetical protein
MIVVAIVLTVVTAGIATAVATAVYGAGASVALASAAAYAAWGATVGFLTGGLSAFLAGGDLGDVLRGALVGAVSGALTGGLHMVGGLANIVGHGVVGGLSNVAMGGKFGDGFLSAAASAATAVSGLTNPGSAAGKSLGFVGRTAIASAAGGTASAIGGGKFANGAYTGAFTHLLNAELKDPNGGWNEAPPKAIRLDQQNLVFEPHGIVAYGKFGQPITGGRLYWIDVGGEILDSFDIRTGGLVLDGSGKPAGSDTQVRDGYYKVTYWRPNRFDKPTFTDFDNRVAYSLNVDSSGWGSRKLWQNLIRIHPDGPIRNSIWTQLGTAGCLGVTNSNNDHIRFFNAASQYFGTNKSLNLHVLKF